MRLDINKYLLVFIGWLIRTSYQLECVQCTSPVRRVTQNWDHSCLDGTLTSVPCQEPPNESNSSFRQCVSAAYRIGSQKSSNIFVYRGCSKSQIAQHECDPANSTTDIDSLLNFYCSYTCLGNGCNRHSYKEITSNANQLIKIQFILLFIICTIFLLYF
ncbi:unnamed protein product [Adineta steineri]|uniref:Protein quiver n=1 Tax=Adineta steineri TaxID=433720 RepID=A0A815Z9B4_9BILA|nr:unnamed protein product [Adineta steineri]